MARKCSVQRSVRTPISPPYFTTMRSKLVQGTKSITCEKRVRPEYMTVPRLKSQNRVRRYRQNLKPCSSRHQKKHPRNPYVAALFYKITLGEPDSTASLSDRCGRPTPPQQILATDGSNQKTFAPAHCVGSLQMAPNGGVFFLPLAP